jgi:hypothetical protein
MEFRKGDRVSVRKQYLKASRADISCLRIVDSGLPNEFMVVAADRSTAGVDAVVLSPCCNRLLDPATGDHACAAHPAELFEIVSRGDQGSSDQDKIMEALGKGDPKFFFSADTPLGSAVRTGYYEDEQNVGFSISLFGLKPVVLAAKKPKEMDIGTVVVELLKEMKILKTPKP